MAAPPPSDLLTMPWLAAAYGEYKAGIHRLGGVGAHNQYVPVYDENHHALNSPRIMEYFAATNSETKTERSSWCSAFVNWCIQQANINGTRSAMAKSWLHWGEKLQGPKVGSVVVFSRGHGTTDSWKGHVAFVWSIGDNGTMEVLGGNQDAHAATKHHAAESSHVSIKHRNIDDALGFLWPSARKHVVAHPKAAKSGPTPDGEGGIMLILRGLADNGHAYDNRPWPMGALREEPAKAFAEKHNYIGQVLNVAGSRSGAGSTQTNMAIGEFRTNKKVNALYGFSAGGYALAFIIPALTAEEKKRLKLVVCLGAPGHNMEHRIQGDWTVIYRTNPPQGHMACPNALLDEGI